MNNSDKTFDQLIKELNALETRCNKYAWALKNPKHSTKLWWKMQPKWQGLIGHIRGYHKEKWAQYCEENNLVPNYNFGDVIA